MHFQNVLVAVGIGMGSVDDDGDDGDDGDDDDDNDEDDVDGDLDGDGDSDADNDVDNDDGGDGVITDARLVVSICPHYPYITPIYYSSSRLCFQYPNITLTVPPWVLCVGAHSHSEYVQDVPASDTAPESPGTSPIVRIIIVLVVIIIVITV